MARVPVARVDDVFYTADRIDVDAGATITACAGAMGVDLVIPDRVRVLGKEYKVTTIGDHAFYVNKLTSVVVPSTVIQGVIQSSSRSPLASHRAHEPT